MASLTIPLPDEDATAALGRALAHTLGPGDTLLLSGPLGAGKTALARALIRALDGDPALEVPSPTYTLVQTYETASGAAWHFDLYRLQDAEAVIELGWDESADGIRIVEWPDRLGRLVPADALLVGLEIAGDGRMARLQATGPRAAGVLRTLGGVAGADLP
jgi:tRNA threonylcarbamoyladenosine biosynthesis protein TsaE